MSGRLHHDLLVGHHVVDEVGVGRGLDLVLAGLDVDDEAQQRAPVVGLREALALQDAAALELGVGVEEAVGGHQRDVGVLGPVREHLLRARGRSSTCRPPPSRRGRSRTACAGAAAVQELLLLAVQPAGRLDVQAEQAGRAGGRPPRTSSRSSCVAEARAAGLISSGVSGLSVSWRRGRPRRARSSSTYGEGSRPGRRAAVVGPAVGTCAEIVAGRRSDPGACRRAGGRAPPPVDSRPCAESWATSGRSRPRTS